MTTRTFITRMAFGLTFYLGLYRAVADEENTQRTLDLLLAALQQSAQQLEHWGRLNGEQCRPIQLRKVLGQFENSINFTLWYRIAVDSEDVSVTWMNNNGVHVDETPIHISDNLWKSNFVIDRTSTPQMIKAMFRCPDIQYTFHINKSQENQTQTDLLPFELYSDPEEEIVYRPNTNTKLQVSGVHIEALALVSHLYNPVTNKIMESQQIGWETWPIFIDYRNRHNQPMVKHFTAATSTFPTSGLIDVNFRSQRSPGNLMHFVEVSRQLTIRPSMQTHPFPDGFIGFDTHGLNPGEDGHFHTVCSNNDRSCEIHCDAYGNQLRRLRMYKSRENLFNGNQVPVTGRIPPRNTFSRKLSTDGKAHNLNEREATFTCIAENEAGANKTMKTVVEYVVDVAVESRIIVQFLSGSRVKITCNAIGRPYPTITFALEYENSYQIVEPTYEALLGMTHKTRAFVITSLYADPETETDRLQEVTCSADVTGSRPGHDHATKTIPNRNRRRHWK